MKLFERYLTLFVAGAIAAGIVLGKLFPGLFGALAEMQVAGVNLPVAVLIWAMVYPMMVAIEPRGLGRVTREPGGIVLTLIVNWLVKPFTMAALGILFFKGIFSGFVTGEEAEGVIAGLILLGAAPCTAMVFVWSQLTKGEPNYTLAQVTVNDLILVVAYAPIVGLLLGVTDIAVPWTTLLLSVALFVAIPLGAGLATRAVLEANEKGRAERFLAELPPIGQAALILTVVLLFGFQGETILERPLLIAMIAVPILIQSYGIFALGYGAAYAMRLPHRIAAPGAMIGTSNFFELAVAVAIGLYGLGSVAALATVVGVLIEVPVMLSLVALANRTRGAFDSRERQPSSEERATA